MTLPTKVFLLTYGTFSAGKGTNYAIDSMSAPFRWGMTEDGSFEFSCNILVSSATTTTFESEAATLEAAFASSNRNKLFLFKRDTVTIFTFDPASNTGFLARPSIRKAGSPHDTQNSRLYTVSVKMKLPAGSPTYRDLQFELGYTNSRLMFFRLSGVYTASGGSQAFAAYLAGVGAIASALYMALGGDWHGPLNETFSSDNDHAPSGSNDIGKVARFSQEWREVKAAQSLDATVDSRFKGPSFTIDAEQPAPGDFAPGGANVVRFQRITARYSSAIDTTQVTPTVAALSALYTNTVLPFMMDRVRSFAGGRACAFAPNAPKIDVFEGRIDATLTAMVAGGGRFVRSSIYTEDETDPGNEILGVWTGEKLAGHAFSNPGYLMRTVVWEYEIVGRSIGQDSLAAGSNGGQGNSGVQINAAVGFELVETSAAEAGLDAFFGIAASAPGDVSGSGEDAGFASAGDVPEPSGLTRVPVRPWTVRIEPVSYGIASLGTIRTTRITRVKRWRYIRPAKGGGGPTGGGGDVRTISPGSWNLQ